MCDLGRQGTTAGMEAVRSGGGLDRAGSEDEESLSA